MLRSGRLLTSILKNLRQKICILENAQVPPISSQIGKQETTSKYLFHPKSSTSRYAVPLGIASNIQFCSLLPVPYYTTLGSILSQKSLLLHF